MIFEPFSREYEKYLRLRVECCEAWQQYHDAKHAAFIGPRDLYRQDVDAAQSTNYENEAKRCKHLLAMHEYIVNARNGKTRPSMFDWTSARWPGATFTPYLEMDAPPKRRAPKLRKRVA